MSMGLVLETMLTWFPTQWPELREKINFGVEDEGMPPPTAGNWYITLDDGGVTQKARPEDYYIHEELTITVAIWRRQSHIPQDKLGNQFLATDKYQPQIKTLDKLEREVVTRLHQNYGLHVAINEAIENGANDIGDKYANVFIYRGRSRNEKLTLPTEIANKSTHSFIGRRLRFSGLERFQPIPTMG